MRFSYPSQRFQDWVSQGWCITTGKRIDPADVGWLMGPFGNVDIIEDRYVAELARSEGLVIEKNVPGCGIVDSLDAFNLSEGDRKKIRPEILDFYLHTSDYEFEVWSQWCQFYRPFAGLITKLYSKRLQQLNLPLSPLDTSRGIRSQIYKLRDPQSGEAKHTIWYRHLKSTQEVIYSGIYAQCQTPDGRHCLKVVFPLPRGNATVVMGIEVGDDGSLILDSKGKRFGDPGFYFLLVDAKGRHYARYLPSLHESIRVFVDDEGVMRADHLLNLWQSKALHLHYRINAAKR